MAKRRRRRRADGEKSFHIQIFPKHVLFVFSFLSIVLLFISYRFPTVLNPVRNGIDVVFSPMQIGISSIGNAIANRIKYFDDLDELRAENEELKRLLESLQNQAQMSSQDKQELAHLRELYNVDKKYSEYPKEAARIIARESNGWYNTFTVDKGTKNGIKVGMNVIAGNGLVGIVTEVRKNTSIIRAVIDDNSNISGMFSSSGDTCIVSGNMNLMKLERCINLSQISLNAGVINSEEVVTSHISDQFLPGILIGYVTEVHVDSSNMTMKGTLIPAVDFEHLKNVLIITKLNDNED